MIKILTIATILLVAWFGFQGFSSQDTAALRIMESDIAVLKKAVNKHYTMKGTYPLALSDLEEGFIGKIPSDPKGNPYRYAVADDGKSFSIESAKNASD